MALAMILASSGRASRELALDCPKRSRLLLDRPWLAAAMLAVGGCGAPVDEALESPQLQAKSAALEVEVPARCTGADVTSPICTGSWLYRRWASCAVGDDESVAPGDCGADDCRQHASCEDWSFGASEPSTMVATYDHRVATCRRRGCFDACEEEADSILAALESLREDVPAEHLDQVVIAEQEEEVVSSRRFSPGLFEDDKFDEIRRCTVTFEYVSPATGVGPACGCIECQTPACGATSETFVSARGLSLARLELEEPQLATSPAPECGTCDQLPIDSPEALRAKFRCLADRRDDPELAAAIDARLRVLATLGADQLSFEQRELAWQAFAEPARQTALACEPTVQAEVAATCPLHRAAELDRDLAICETFAEAAEGRVRATAAWVAAERCVELLGRLSLATSPSSPDRDCLGPDTLTQARDAVSRLLRGSMAALEENAWLGEADGASSERYPELERTLWRVDRWYAAERALLEAIGSDDWEARAERSLGEMLSAFWDAAHRSRRTTLELEQLLEGDTASETDVAGALVRAARRADRLDRDVLRAAYRGAGTRIEPVRDGTVEILPPIALPRTVASGDVLLQLTSESLTGLWRALEAAEPFVDLACRLSGCGPHALTASLEETRLSALWRTLAALDTGLSKDDDAGTLGDAVERLPDDSEWKAVFEVLAGNQAALRAAVEAATGGESSLRRLDAGAVSPALGRLVAVVRGAEQSLLQYEARGASSGLGTRRLRANVSPAGRDATLAAVDAALRRFASDVARFQSERRDAVSDALQRSGAERSLAAVRERLAGLERNLERLDADAGGLAAALLRLDRGPGEVADRALDVQGALDEGSFTSVGDTRRFEVTGRSGSRWVDVERLSARIQDVAARGIELGGADLSVIAADAGELIALGAEGQYSPLCSLARHDGRQPRGFFSSLDGLVGSGAGPDEPALSLRPQPGTTIGPEGFVLTREASLSRAQARDDDAKDNGFLQAALGTVDLVLGAATGGTSGLPAIGGVGRIINGLLSGQDPVENSTQSSQSDSVRFQGGLRLPETPFPNLPAGALLLVELPRGVAETGAIRAIHLVQRPSTSFVVRQDADLYFVVNDFWNAGDPDCQRLAPADDPNRVSVSLRRAQPDGAIARDAMQALAEALERLREQRADFLRQGRVLSTQIAELRAGAMLEFEALSGLDFSSLPPVVQDLVEAFITREVAAVEVAVERQSVERRVADLGFEIDALLADAAALRDGARVASLLPRWRLRSFDELRDGSDERSLVESARGLLETTTQTLLPILELWHPDALAEARSSSTFRRDAEALANVGPNTDLLSVVDDAERLLQRLRDAYDADPITHLSDPLNQPIVGVSFPRPAEWGTPCPFCVQSASGFPTASAARSFAVWTAIEAALSQGRSVPERACVSDADCFELPGTRCALEGGAPRCQRAPTRVDFGVGPGDIYRPSGGQATLACFLATPVVQQWGLLFANQADDFDLELRQLSQTGRRLEPRSRPTQPFVTEGGLVDYEITERTSLTSGISLLYSSVEAAFFTFQSFANERLLQGRNPVGLSAFADLSVDFAPLASMTHSFGNGIGEATDRPVTELILLLRLDAREFASDPPGRELHDVVQSCAPAQR